MLGAEPLLAGVFSPSGRLVGDAARDLLTRALGAGAGSAALGPMALALAPGRPRTSEQEIAAVGSSAGGLPPARLGDLETIEGPFALAGWGEGAGRGVLACDRAGAAPLFVAERDGTLFFASEVHPLLELLPHVPEPDVVAVARWLVSGVSGGGGTLYRGVRRLGAGRVLELSRTGWSERTWWVPRARPASGDPVAVLRDAVAASCAGAGGASAAVLVSGGLDSSAVAAFAARAARDRGLSAPLAVTATLPSHPELDESAHAAAVAGFWDLELATVPIRPRALLGYSDRFLAAVGLPLAYPAMALFAPLLDAARDTGAEVVLDGEGGDELFGAEPFLVADMLRRADVVGTLRVAASVPGVGRPVTARALGRVVAQWGVRGALPLGLHERLKRPSQPDWLRPEVAAALADERWAWKRAPGPRWVAHLRHSLTDARDEFRVRDELRRSAALAGVRVRHPLLDPALSEVVLGLPPREAFHPRHDRWLLRRALDGLLPASVLLREDKPSFGALIGESLLEHDAEAVGQLADTSEPRIEVVLRTGAIAETLARVREAPGRRSTLELWRMLTLERWLTSTN